MAVVYLCVSFENKISSTVNTTMRHYFLWAERQAGRRVTKCPYPPTEAWYAEKGIEHDKVGPKGSHLNPVKRSFSHWFDATKELHDLGFFRSMWRYIPAAYVKNRVHCRRIDRISYLLFFECIHPSHLAVGSLAYFTYRRLQKARRKMTMRGLNLSYDLRKIRLEYRCMNLSIGQSSFCHTFEWDVQRSS
ncbi:hypothetical protein PsorP6_016999 [Peronosclerospora sorghi]|uniref:Uncharacterized protein n=1 Tax=Peronosclerospora sorghi TaxID=230839 RepID=A0ACC0WC23_9STRA|nr:hypothetical protein PsorP6_016999 [Peronosclerospora sorghi]